jgi:hypothetical protein
LPIRDRNPYIRSGKIFRAGKDYFQENSGGPPVQNREIIFLLLFFGTHNPCPVGDQVREEQKKETFTETTIFAS